MLLTITTTHRPATDLGYLLAKHPDRAQAFDRSCGRAHVVYPEATPERCTVALLLDVDPVGLVRGRGQQGGSLEQYVNDRPYVASSFLSVAIAQVFRTAYSGRCKERPALAATPLPLAARLEGLPCRGADGLLQRLLEPPRYEVTATRLHLDPEFADWGDSDHYTVELRQTVTLADLLTHLDVLVPALDSAKHDAIGDDEVGKLLARGEGWLAAHPARERIARRYLRQRGLGHEAHECVFGLLALESEPVDARL